LTRKMCTRKRRESVVSTSSNTHTSPASSPWSRTNCAHPSALRCAVWFWLSHRQSASQKCWLSTSTRLTFTILDRSVPVSRINSSGTACTNSTNSRLHTYYYIPKFGKGFQILAIVMVFHREVIDVGGDFGGKGIQIQHIAEIW